MCPPSHTDPCPHVRWFHAEGSESARDDMVPCFRALGSSVVFDFNRARPCHYVDCIRSWLMFLSIDPTSVNPTTPREKHCSAGQTSNSRTATASNQGRQHCRHGQRKL